MTSANVILVVENNALDQAHTLSARLQSDDYQLVTAHDFETAKTQATHVWPNLIVWQQGSGDAAQLQQELNQIDLNIPWVMVGSSEQSTTLVNSQTSWVASDNASQLTNVVIKNLEENADRFVRFRHIALDCQSRQVLNQAVAHPLTPKEFRLLHLLLVRHDQILTRKEIMQHVWQTDYMGDTRTLDVHIRWLRQKIEVDAARPDFLKTVRGEGYIFVTRSLRPLRDTAPTVSEDGAEIQ